MQQLASIVKFKTPRNDQTKYRSGVGHRRPDFCSSSLAISGDMALIALRSIDATIQFASWASCSMDLKVPQLIMLSAAPTLNSENASPCSTSKVSSGRE